jgi:hypothetical protein
MKNADYVIYIKTGKGRAWKYSKDTEGWTQAAPSGKVRRMSAEQLLSHLLPPLAHDQANLNVRVEHKTREAELA